MKNLKKYFYTLLSIIIFNSSIVQSIPVRSPENIIWVTFGKELQKMEYDAWDPIVYDLKKRLSQLTPEEIGNIPISSDGNHFFIANKARQRIKSPDVYNNFVKEIAAFQKANDANKEARLKPILEIQESIRLLNNLTNLIPENLYKYNPTKNDLEAGTLSKIEKNRAMIALSLFKLSENANPYILKLLQLTTKKNDKVKVTHKNTTIQEEIYKRFASNASIVDFAQKIVQDPDHSLTKKFKTDLREIQKYILNNEFNILEKELPKGLDENTIEFIPSAIESLRTIDFMALVNGLISFSQIARNKNIKQAEDFIKDNKSTLDSIKNRGLEIAQTLYNQKKDKNGAVNNPGILTKYYKPNYEKNKQELNQLQQILDGLKQKLNEKKEDKTTKKKIEEEIKKTEEQIKTTKEEIYSNFKQSLSNLLLNIQETRKSLIKIYKNKTPKGRKAIAWWDGKNNQSYFSRFTNWLFGRNK